MIIKFSRLLNCNHKLLTNRFFNRNLCNIPTSKSKVEYLLIIDFEATCDKDSKMMQEIIEFPCLKINAEKMIEEGRFHYYVKPLINPILSEFCINLTGISQEVVDTGVPFSEVYKLFAQWRENEGLTDENSLYVTSGDWDLGYMMPSQCQISGLKIPNHMRKWIDIKKLNAIICGTYEKNLIKLLEYHGLSWQGRKHSGIADCLNIHCALKKLHNLGAKFEPTSKITKKEYKMVQR